MELNEKLIKLRKREKLSQEQLAERLGVTRQTISNWESATTKPDITQLKNISQIFNTSIDELVDNNIRNIIEKKISNAEKLTNKNTKSIKIIIITIYFIILSLLISFIIYCFTNKDFTDEYQMEITCTIDDKELFIDVSSEYDEDDIINNYILEIKEHYNGHTKSKEKYNAGNSVADAIDSIRYVKEILISQGAICK